MSKVSLPGGNLPRTGETVGRFRIERELARGGLGAVFVAQDARGERVALKVLLHPERGSGMERFRREAQLGMTLRHEGLCPVLQFGEHAGMAYLTMPLLEGALPITDYVHAKGLATRERVGLLLQAIEAMHAAHEATAVHRDLKPGNVLVTPDGRVKVVDFGLGKQEGQDRLTQTGQILGTVNYMAPEQVMGEGVRADARCDVFALGVLLYELITDELPFEDETSVGVMRAILSRDTPDVGAALAGDLAGLSAVIRIALAKDPDQRYPTAQAFASDVRSVLEGHGLSDLARSARTKGRAPRVAAALGLALLTCCAVLLGTLYHGRAARLEPAEVVRRAEVLGKTTGHRLRTRRSLITHPPELAWRVELEVLERAAGDSVPEALALAQARDAALRGLTALATGDRRGAEAALTRLCSAEKALARVADDAREAGALRRALAGAVAAVSTQSDPKQAAEDLASAIEEADLRVPELRSWRAQARVRCGLESREQIDEATSDLLAAGRSRALTRSERLALGRIHLHTWDVKQVIDVLSEIRTLPPELKAGLALARAQSAVNHDDPAAACEHLRGLSAGLTGYEERREAMRGAALRRAEAFLPAVERRALVDSDRRRLLDELRLARAVCPSVALPKATIDVLLAAANDARGLDFKLGAALAELAPDDYDTQSAVGILGLQKKGNKAEQAIMLVAVRRALAMAPAEDRERLIVALVQSLYYADAWKQVIAETWLHLPEVTDGIARLALFVEATAAALSLKRYDEAMKFIDLAFAVQPGHVKFRYYRAEVRFKQGRLDETYEDALAFATSGVESGSTQHAMAISWLWDYALPQGRRQPVRRAIESFLRADPRDRGGWDARAAALQLADGDLETAATSLGRAEESLRQSGKPKWMALAARTAAAAEAVTKRGLAAQAEVDATVAQLDRIRGSGHRP